MNLTTDSSFRFSALLKLNNTIKINIHNDLNQDLFPSVAEMAINSRVFSNYAETVRSCKVLMEDICKNINGSLPDKKFMVGAEVNPEVSKLTSISDEWLENEVSRFWVYDNTTEGKELEINAVCRGSIFVVDTPPVSHTVH